MDRRSGPRLAVALACMAAACGGSDRTCLNVSVSYGGSTPGTACVRVAGTQGLRIVGCQPSVEVLARGMNGGVTCWQGADRSDISGTAQAWIDTAGTAATACAGPDSDRCAPGARDPQVTKPLLIPAGELTSIQLPIEDPR